MPQHEFVDWELPIRPLSFLVKHGWKPIKKIQRYRVGYLVFRKFRSGHVVHNRIYTVLSFFEALIFLVMLRNAKTPHCCDCWGRKVFQLCLATTEGFTRRLPQTPVSISCNSQPRPGSVKKWKWLYRLPAGSIAVHLWTKQRTAGFRNRHLRSWMHGESLDSVTHYCGLDSPGI
jgi:hypothetical protein